MNSSSELVLVVFVCILLFAINEKRTTVVGSEIKRKSDATIEVIGKKYILKEK